MKKRLKGVVLGLMAAVLFFNGSFSVVYAADEDAVILESDAGESGSGEDFFNDENEEILEEASEESSEELSEEELIDVSENSSEAASEAISDEEIAQEDELLAESEEDEAELMGGAGANEAGPNIRWSYDAKTRTLKFVGTGDMFDYSPGNLPSWRVYADTATTDSLWKIEIDPRITSIGDYAFYDMGQVHNLNGQQNPFYFPKKLKKIGQYAFYKTYLTYAYLPDEVTEIKAHAFEGCHFTAMSAFPKGVVRVEDEAFWGAMITISNITFDKIKYIGNNAFHFSYYNNKSAKINCVFPDTLEYIGDGAFASCDSVGSSFRLPDTLKHLGDYPFQDMTALTGEFVYPKCVSTAKLSVLYKTGFTSAVFNSNIKKIERDKINYDISGNLKKLVFNCDFPDMDSDIFYELKQHLDIYYPENNANWILAVKGLYYDPAMVSFRTAATTATVKFVGIDGKTVVSTAQVKSGQKITAPNEALLKLKTGQELAGWYLTKGDGLSDSAKWNFDDPVMGSMTLYAGIRNDGYCTVTYYTNVNGKVIIQKVKYGEKAVAPKLERPGYRFVGWFSTPRCNLSTGFNQPITKDMVAYAKWETFYPIITYIFGSTTDTKETVTYYGYNDGIQFDPLTSEVKKFEDTGFYKFLGWYFDEEFTKKVSADYKPTVDATVYGRWDTVKHKVTYEYGDGREPKVQYLEHNYRLALSETPQRAGFSFKGWSAEKGSDKYIKESVRILGDTTFYAVWSAKATFVYCFEGDEDKVITREILTTKTFAEAIPDVERWFSYSDRRTGIKWYHDVEATRPVEDSYVIAGGDVFYGIAQIKEVTITVDPNNGEPVYQFKTKAYRVPDIKIPVREGYDFEKWEITTGTVGNYSSGYVVTDTTFKAIWVPRKVQLNIRYVHDTTYTGKPIKMNFSIQRGNYEYLKKGRDYTEKYSNNVKVGTATITITYKGNYRGVQKVHFNITPYEIDNSFFRWNYEQEQVVKYNGKVQKIKPKIAMGYDGKGRLKYGKDYVLEYVDADKPGAYKNVGEYTIKVKGIGNCTGEIEIKEIITDKKPVKNLKIKNLKKSYRCADDTSALNFTLWDGKKKIASFKNGEFTSDVLDYIDKPSMKYPGTDYVGVAAKEGSKYYGELYIAIKKVGIPISEAVFDGFKSSIPYNADGDNTQAFEIYANAKAAKAKDKSKLLVELKDYQLFYSDTSAAGKVSVTVRGIGKYTGTVSKTYTIVGRDITKVKILGVSDVTYKRSYITFEELSLYDAETDTTLKGINYYNLSDAEKKNYNYTYYYSNNYYAGTAKLVIEGLGEYAGKVTKTFKIKPVDITDNPAFTVNCSGYGAYSKKGALPSYYNLLWTNVSLTRERDYTVTITGNKKVGATATVLIKGKGNFTGTQKVKFKVTKGSIGLAKVSFKAPRYADKKGNFVCSGFAAVDENGSKLVKGKDYTVEYKYKGITLNTKKDRVPNGAYVEVVFTGRGNYSGTNTKQYTLRNALQSYSNIAVPISKVKFSIRDYYYTGSEIKPSKINIVGTYNGKRISSDDFYVDSYSKNVKVGTATIKLKGAGKFSGTTEVTFKIKPSRQ